MVSEKRVPLGQLALLEALRLEIPAPYVKSFAAPGTRRTEVLAGGEVLEWYPKGYHSGDDPISNLRFALRYEPLDLRLLRAAFQRIDEGLLARWIQEEPTGAYSRRAWFLFETLTGKSLDLPDAQMGNYVPALNSDFQFVADRRNSRRHLVIDNLLGDWGMYVTVRKTPHLKVSIDNQYDQAARSIVESYDQTTLIRAIQYLYTKETRSSFAIEGERASSRRAERFVAALRDAPNFDLLDKEALIQLQGKIVDDRFAASDWRSSQNFVGETIGGYREKVHFICPRPEDVEPLMDQWLAMSRRLLASNLDPVIAAALISFSFVFIHPFEDGNGRIHRFLIHGVLARMGFSPPNIIFPISASIVRTKHLYDQALETFSRPLLDYIEWHLTQDTELVVENETAHLYQSFDATKLAEYLYDRVADTVAYDLVEELGFLAVYDKALAAAKEIVDMPDRRLSLLVRLCMENAGRLAARRRSSFLELTDEEIRQIEEAVQRAKVEENAAHPFLKSPEDPTE